MRHILQKSLQRLEILEEQRAEEKKKLKKAEEDLVIVEQTLSIIQSAATNTQGHLSKHLSNIVTQAIQTVLEKPYEFVCEFVERRGSTEADLYLIKNGNRYGILTGTGGGVADICSFALKVAYLLLSNVDRVLIIDEVSRHINSAVQRRNFALVVSQLSKELGIQLIINTTIPELHDVADNIIQIENVNEESRAFVKEL